MPPPLASPHPVSAEAAIDLAVQTPLATIYAADQGDLRSDQPALALGDFNADGLDDILVGARFADGPSNGRGDAGEAYVIFGAQGLPESLDIALEQQDVTILGAAAGDNLGFSALAADINGDRTQDIIVGAPFANHPGFSGQPGVIYVVFGRQGLPARLDLAASAADLTIVGAGSGGFFGDSLAAGDLNGDGRADLLVGATFDAVGPPGGSSSRTGAAYAFFGREQWPSLLRAGADSDVALIGADEFDELGDFVASGDINGDGLDDMIVTAEAADGPNNARLVAAEVHVLYGRRDLAGVFRISEGQQDLWVAGADAQDTLGASLAVADLNGDGVDDLVMGARLARGPDNALPSAGEVYVLFGRPQLPSFVDLAQPPDFVALLHSADAADLLGSAVHAADVDGDGVDELLLGVAFGDGPDNGRSDAGDLYVVDAQALKGSTSLPASRLLLAVFGATAGERLGSSLATGDLDGDGAMQLVTVAMDADGPTGERKGSGRVYVLPLAEPR